LEPQGKPKATPSGKEKMGHFFPKKNQRQLIFI